MKIAQATEVFNKENAEEMKACLKHLKTYDGAISNVVRGVEHAHNWIDNTKKEMESLKG